MKGAKKSKQRGGGKRRLANGEHPVEGAKRLPVAVGRLRSHLKKFLGRWSRMEYLALFAAMTLEEIEPDEVAARFAAKLKELSERVPDADKRKFNSNNVAMRADQIATLREELPGFVTDLLIVDLEAFLHGFLADVAEEHPTDDAKPIEALVAALWPRDSRLAAQERKSGRGAKGRSEHWSYKQVMLLSEVRNAVVHGNGEVLMDRSKRRLKNAGWTEGELTTSKVLTRRSFNDLRRFKRAVRTLANHVLDALEVRRGEPARQVT